MYSSRFRERSPIGRLSIDDRLDSHRPARQGTTYANQNYDVVLVPCDDTVYEYAEAVGKRFNARALTAFVETLRPDANFQEAMYYWANQRQVPFVVEIERRHQQHYACSLFVQRGENFYRHMHVDEAVNMVRRIADETFADAYVTIARPSRAVRSLEHLKQMATPRYAAYLMNLLADCRCLTLDELVYVRNYLDERCQNLARVEGVRAPPLPSMVAPPLVMMQVPMQQPVIPDKSLIFQQNSFNERLLQQSPYSCPFQESPTPSVSTDQQQFCQTQQLPPTPQSPSYSHLQDQQRARPPSPSGNPAFNTLFA